MKQQTETRYKAEPEYAAPGSDDIVKLVVRREVTTTPVTAGGAVQWRKASTEVTELFEVKTMHVAGLVAELVDWLAYSASGKAFEDAR